MLTPNWADVPHDHFTSVDRVVSAAATAAKLEPTKVMLIGAVCRDLLHTALGHDFPNTSTSDLDLAIAISSWESYERIIRTFPRVGGSRIRFRIAGYVVDVVPFGAVEDPRGVVDPPNRNEPLSVWAFDEIHDASEQLRLPSGIDTHIPTVPGYAAAKLGAWLDRSAWGRTTDAPDLALVLFWYAEAADTIDLLYDTDDGIEILVAEGMDVMRAAAHLLGRDVLALIGQKRQAELAERWPGDVDLLCRGLTATNAPAWTTRLDRRHELIEALTRGLGLRR